MRFDSGESLVILSSATIVNFSYCLSHQCRLKLCVHTTLNLGVLVVVNFILCACLSRMFIHDIVVMHPS